MIRDLPVHPWCQKCGNYLVGGKCEHCLMSINSQAQCDLLSVVTESGGCLGLRTDGCKCVDMDTYGKANGMTVTLAPWHPNPEYRIFKTGSLLSRNSEYPSGLVIVNEKGVPQPWKSVDAQK